jgi:hypothetical protein
MVYLINNKRRDLASRRPGGIEGDQAGPLERACVAVSVYRR